MTERLPDGRPPAASIPDGSLDEVRDFLRDHVSTYEELEALVFLARRRRRSATAAEVGAGARMPTLIAVKALDDLRRGGLVDEVREDRRTSYVFWPATPELARVAERFVEVYEANPVDVIQLMSAAALDRLRSTASRAFAEAFVIRRRNR